ncbi:hypothetical protein BmHG_00242 [Borrelia miyamotoi]|uniref:Uncharacterized protein n=1 Tax=Borrelia miyamotoi TaxID=47466 RepID=A0AAP8YU62_9SPIR|nr:hypothetical protein [Borrelia miyamotoi]ATQ14963.2 hypothetical protein CNO14_03090 [Borrelia miyamotoi]ATQ16146.2 hypothetical protein CNO13_03090 [Borrelia miyamotoi]ATQ17291.2 hypothetical protein CNO12_03095 [Borrelia miyamotoi]ATQ18203.2 hypothetical protein CNO11_01155 [Borrelia miyamotoi]ATQ19786.2 hypothetical protein CNO10_03095 [Borrelia miyamotoi]
MRKLVLLFLFFYLAFINLFAGNGSLVDDRQKELAIFYYEVGQRYVNVGKVKKGRIFQKKALEIYPKLKEEVNLKDAVEEIDFKIKLEGGEPSFLAFDDIKLDDIPGITHDEIEISEVTNAPKIEYIANVEREKYKEQAVKFQFNKFVRALLLQNIDLLNSVMADEIKVWGKVKPKADFISNLKVASNNVNKDDLSYLAFDDFYDFKSLSIIKNTDTSYNVKVKAKINDLTKNIPFWTDIQTLCFVKQHDKWVLSSIK